MTLFLGECYGVKNAVDLSEVRFTVRKKRTEGGKLSNSVKVESLPPTKEVFEQNVFCAHYQAIIWVNSLSLIPQVWVVQR